MPYRSNQELPPRIRRLLPTRAQDIFRAAFNAAYERYGPSHEASLFRIAWAAVKRDYEHVAPGLWLAKVSRTKRPSAHRLRTP